MAYSYVLLFLSFIALSACQNCVTYDFEDFNEQFDISGICSLLITPPWEKRSYSIFGPASPHTLSKTFISPTTRMSCSSSFPLEMQSGGLLQLNVYWQPTISRDEINVRVYEKISSGQDSLVSTVTINMLDTDFKVGPNTLNLTLPEGTGTFEGYVS